MAFAILEDGCVGEADRIAVETKLRGWHARTRQGDSDRHAEPAKTRRCAPMAENHIKRVRKRLCFCLR